MKTSNDTLLISIDSLLEEKMRIINGEKVLLDFELAELLQVPTNDIIRKVRANKERFPTDFLIKIPANKFLHSLPPSEKRRKILYTGKVNLCIFAGGFWDIHSFGSCPKILKNAKAK